MIPQPPRLLMIPSWYPSKVDPLAGSFFTEQALLLQQRYDVRVLFGYCPYLGRKSFYSRYRWFVKQELGKTWPNKIQDPLPTIRFDYGHWWLGERGLIEAAIKGYRKMLSQVIDKGWKPDILHAQCTELAGIITARLAEEFHIPWLLTEHQVFALANYNDNRQKLMREAIRSADSVAVVSQHQLRCIAIHSINRPMVVVGNLIDEEVFQLALPKKDPRPFRILTITWPSWIKDPETFFKAIAVLAQNGREDIEVVVIGKELFSEANTEAFQDLAEKFQVQGVCHLIPYVPHSEMAQYYAECDVFVSTSVAETFGIAVREAMAVGRPVVCTASGGIDDDIFDFNGIKVDIGDFHGVAAALMAIKTGSVKYDPIKIRDYVVSKYGRQAFLNKMSAVIDKAMGQYQAF